MLAALLLTVVGYHSLSAGPCWAPPGLHPALVVSAVLPRAKVP
jgi:hypothetical protein